MKMTTVFTKKNRNMDPGAENRIEKKNSFKKLTEGKVKKTICLFGTVCLLFSFTGCANLSSSSLSIGSGEDYMITVDGKKIDFPCTCQDLVDLGYSVDTDLEKKIEPLGGEYVTFYTDNDNYYLVVYVKNNTQQEVSLNDCSYVFYYVMFKNAQYITEVPTVETEEGFDIAGKTRDEVRSSLGTPDHPENVASNDSWTKNGFSVYIIYTEDIVTGIQYVPKV